MSQQKLLQQQQTQNQHTAALLLAEADVQNIDWSDEKLDLQMAFAKIRNLLAARSANTNAVCQALPGNTSIATGNSSDVQPLSAAANSNLDKQNLGNSSSNNATNESNTMTATSLTSDKHLSKIPDTLGHVPIGSATSLGIYFYLFFILLFLFYYFGILLIYIICRSIASHVFFVL